VTRPPRPTSGRGPNSDSDGHAVRAGAGYSRSAFRVKIGRQRVFWAEGCAKTAPWQSPKALPASQGRTHPAQTSWRRRPFAACDCQGLTWHRTTATPEQRHSTSPAPRVPAGGLPRPNIGRVHCQAWSMRGSNPPTTCDRESATAWPRSPRRPAAPRRIARTVQECGARSWPMSVHRSVGPKSGLSGRTPLVACDCQHQHEKGTIVRRYQP
jgi:hypothetical protein